MQASISNRFTMGAAIMLLRLVLLFGAIIHLVSCQKEEEHAVRDYPRIKTLEVTDISEEGVTFNARFLSGDPATVIRAGFVWNSSLAVEPIINSGDTAIVRGTLSSTFQKRIDHSLEKNSNYRLRAFVITETHTVYGPIFTFTSKGSGAPLITGVLPGKGKSGDFITITGNNFSNYYLNNTIYLGDIPVTPYEAQRTTLKFAIPLTHPVGKVSLRVAVAGMTAQAPESFELE